MSFHLWPPLESIESSLSDSDAGPSDFAELMDLPLGQKTASKSLAQQSRQSSLDRPSSNLAELTDEPWEPGSLISIKQGRAKAGVLLDRHIRGERWAGWLTASEASWASAFDVLLEADDEPFESRFGVVQAWNRVELECSQSISWQLSGCVSQHRLGCIRLVAQEYAAGLLLNIPPEPGQIALRIAGGVQMVLTGTPLGKNDPRREYQKLYRLFAARMVATQLTQRIGARSESTQETRDTRELPAVADFRVRLRPGIMMYQVQPLLRATLAYVINGPDHDNCYSIKSSNPAMARAMFSQSILIDRIFEI